ncbi:unnamed protein product [Mytilus edulis]|uniref:TIR domain-containing protein n=1 Tax=Mytilus edulis TaxID=6550 RepID=A0A8S3RCT1_MYTED|nr:unnamed protein product [Mytilus edulis]
MADRRRGKGRWLMEQLESRYHFRCVSLDQIVQTGGMVGRNIAYCNQNSVIILLLISNQYFRSVNFELGPVFNSFVSNEKGTNRIILVRIGDILLPPVFNEMPCIDWRQNEQEEMVADIQIEYCKRAKTSNKTVRHVKMQNTNTGNNPYVLPEGKEYHIFIACSGEDSEKGRWLMEQLESRYPFRCVYHERDFQPGVMIVENMRDCIDKSIKFLLLISNGFNRSYHCRLEETFAISVSNETGHNCIIPVLLEDVPPSFSIASHDIYRLETTYSGRCCCANSRRILSDR